MFVKAKHHTWVNRNVRTIKSTTIIGNFIDLIHCNVGPILSNISLNRYLNLREREREREIIIGSSLAVVKCKFGFISDQSFVSPSESCNNNTHPSQSLQLG